jgi:uncharacterized protein YkwD
MEKNSMKEIKNFRSSIIVIVTASLLMVSAMPIQTGTISNVNAGKYGDIIPESYELVLLDKINENRSGEGAPPLKLNTTLWWVARAHSQDMIDYDFFDHTSSEEGQFNGATFKERVNTYAEYASGYVGECIAMKSSGIDPEWCMAAWKGSPPHWDIIINPNLKEVGLGIVQGDWDGYPNAALYTADFGGAAISVDLAISPSDIQFEPDSPAPGQDVSITATIYNLGNTDAHPVSVEFYDGDPASGGVQIGEEQQIPHILIHDEIADVNVIWSAPGGSEIHNIYVVVDGEDIIAETDEENNVATKPLSMTIPESPIHLEYGWNLVSFPQLTTDDSLDSVLASISGDYDTVKSYISSDPEDPWKSYLVQKPATMNDLNELNNKLGFWIHITNPSGADLAVDGDDPSSAQYVSLAEGWNLVGYPSQTERIRDEALNNLEFGTHLDSIQYYDPDTDTLKELEEDGSMKPGIGYWIYAVSESQWIVL